MECGNAAVEMKKLGKDLAKLLEEDPDKVDNELLEESTRLASLVSEAIEHHACVPTVLGQRQSRLVHKTHNFLHPLWLECNSWGEVKEILECHTDEYTTDGGTEAKLRKGLINTAQHFPWWTGSPASVADEEAVTTDLI